MTSQRDPDQPQAGNFMRRENGKLNLLPILAGALFVVFVGYMLLDRTPGPMKIATPAQTTPASPAK